MDFPYLLVLLGVGVVMLFSIAGTLHTIGFHLNGIHETLREIARKQGS